MRKNCMKNLRNRIRAIVVAASMIALAVTTPVYAESTYDMGYYDLVGQNCYATPTATSDWYGTYISVTDGDTYGIEIAPSWDDPNVWNVTAMGILYNNGIDERTSWNIKMMPEDPTYATAAIAYVEDGVADINWGMTEDEEFNAIEHPSDTTNYYDLLLIKYTGDDGTIYMDVAPSPDIDYGRTPVGAPDTAFAPSDDDMPTYKKISDSYGFTFSDWTTISVPDWYWDMTNDGDPIIINWVIQSNTPAGQAPIDRLQPALYDWYYSDGSGVG